MSKMKVSCTSVKVVKIRIVEPANEKDQETNDNWPVCPCLKLVMICGTRAEILKIELIIGVIPCIYELIRIMRKIQIEE